ncbi:unnamed protein product, partial [Urochloa humidicola]
AGGQTTTAPPRAATAQGLGGCASAVRGLGRGPCDGRPRRWMVRERGAVTTGLLQRVTDSFERWYHAEGFAFAKVVSFGSPRAHAPGLST